MGNKNIIETLNFYKNQYLTVTKGEEFLSIVGIGLILFGISGFFGTLIFESLEKTTSSGSIFTFLGSIILFILEFTFLLRGSKKKKIVVFTKI